MKNFNDFFVEIAKDIFLDLGSRAIRKLVWGIIIGDPVFSCVLLRVDFLQLAQKKGNVVAFIAYLFMILGVIAFLIAGFYWVKGKFTRKSIVSRTLSETKIVNKSIVPLSHSRESSFREKQITAIHDISKLINVAVDSSLRFSEGISLQNEPILKEQCVIARNNGKAIMDYYKTENNRLYYSALAREKITELWGIISNCTWEMFIAIQGNFQVDLWKENVNRLQRTKILRNELDTEFQEILAME